ncbi:MAG: hypothetical protein FWB82_05230 [Treponema sp.]|nr:hypothetical protein [Treponema sp.]
MDKHGFYANKGRDILQNTQSLTEHPAGNTPEQAAIPVDFMAVFAEFAAAIGEMDTTIQSIRNTISRNNKQIKMLSPSSIHKTAEKPEPLHEDSTVLKANALPRRNICR